MAGGTFNMNQPKVRPGNYMNFEAKKKIEVPASKRGICVIPLIGYDWGPHGTFVTLINNSPDGEKAKLGRSIYDDNDFMRLIRLAFENAVKVHVYLVSGGTKAEKTEGALTITALYGGARGNDITVTSTANLDGGYDISVYLAGELVEVFIGVETIEALAAVESEYVRFSGEGVLTVFAGAVLTGGKNEAVTNQSVTEYLDRIEKVKFNTALIPSEDEVIQNVAASKIKYLREAIGKTVQFVMPNFEADYLGVVNVVNSFHKDGVDLSVSQAAAWVTGATAGADKITSNTYKVVKGATAVVGEFSNEKAEEAIKAGKFFFSTSDDTEEVMVEYDINSLVHLSEKQDDSYKKNRVIRVFDSFADDLNAIIKPAQFDNEPIDWGKMTQLGQLLLKKYSNTDGNDGAIKNVDLENDFCVNKPLSTGDSTYFDINIQPVDSSEKLYYTIKTQ